jgi:hypothetical protein
MTPVPFKSSRISLFLIVALVRFCRRDDAGLYCCEGIIKTAGYYFNDGGEPLATNPAIVGFYFERAL